MYYKRNYNTLNLTKVQQNMEKRGKNAPQIII